MPHDRRWRSCRAPYRLRSRAAGRTPNAPGPRRRADEAARAQILANEEARRGVMLSLVSDVAQAYFELLELDLQLEIARRTTESFRDSLDIFRRRLEGGVASRLETARASASLAQTAATVPNLERLIVFKENQI